MGRKKPAPYEVIGSTQENKGIVFLVATYYDEMGARNRPTRSTGLNTQGNQRILKSMLQDYVEEVKSQLKKAEHVKITANSLFSKIIDDYLAFSVTRVSANSLSKYTYAASHIKKYFDNQGITIQELRTEDIAKYLAYKQAGDKENGIKPMAAASLSYHKTVINGAICYAIDIAKVITENAALSVPAPKRYRRLPSFYTGAQLSEVFELMADEAMYSVIVLTATFGFRRQEVLGLRWSAINEQAGTITVCHTATKVGNEVVYADRTKSISSLRTLNIPDSTMDYLRRLYAKQKEQKALCKSGYIDSDYVCKWPDGHLFTPDYVSNKWRTLLVKHNLPHIRFHDLRHSAASLLLAEGYSLKEIQEYLGHADIKSTDIYTHMQPAAKKKMASTMGSVLKPRINVADTTKMDSGSNGEYHDATQQQ